MATLQHFDKVVKTLHHLASAVVLDDERHLELRMLLQVVELPRVEIGDELAVVLQGAIDEPMVQALWQVM